MFEPVVVGVENIVLRLILLAQVLREPNLGLLEPMEKKRDSLKNKKIGEKRKLACFYLVNLFSEPYNCRNYMVNGNDTADIFIRSRSPKMNQNTAVPVPCR